ncbi:MAG: phosphoglycerate dehydrogenase [Clostridia bacterium]|nr:phosphoglycerate dehydrogenase [Clostridia bacterium]
MKVLKLNSISPVADKEFPANYEYGDAVEQPDGIMVRSAVMHDYPMGDNLLAIARAGAGVNNIPVDKCAEKGIVVFNTPGANANAVKELVICELFLGGRKIIDSIEWMKTLKDDPALSKTAEKGKSKFVGGEVLGKTLGVVGLGAIGAMVANTALDLGMNVMGYDPFISINAAWMLNNKVQRVMDTDTIFKTADYITLHVPATGDTKGMINADTLAKCKDGVVIINNARGELVDSKAMIEAVRSGKVARYITDFPTSDMLEEKNIICVPHLGASTPEAEDNCAVMAASELVDYLENGNIVHSVNFPDVSMPNTSAQRITVMHKNVKEVLSKILAIVSGEGINIAHMQDKSKGDYAYLMLDIDEVADEAVIEKIKAIEEVIKVRVIK